MPDDPPPDLVIESDYTSSSVDKQSLYAVLGVPELWRYTKKTLFVYERVADNYEQRDSPLERLCQRSVVFPCFPIVEIPKLIEQSRTIGQRSSVRLFRQQLRESLAGK